MMSALLPILTMSPGLSVIPAVLSLASELHSCAAGLVAADKSFSARAVVQKTRLYKQLTRELCKSHACGGCDRM
jgi:hypothetical protein